MLGPHMPFNLQVMKPMNPAGLSTQVDADCMLWVSL